MKKPIALIVALAFTLGAAGFVLAQTTTPAPEKKMEKMEKSGEMKKSGEKKMAAKTATGTVKSASTDSLVVSGKEKGKEAEWTFAIDPKTTIKKAGKSVTASDLKEGDSVQVKYMEREGKAMAQTVMVRSAPKKAASDAPKK